MNKQRWFFPTTGGGAKEGVGNPGNEHFRGNPLRALAREVTQNSLDAEDQSGRPVILKFTTHYVEVNDFPGISDYKRILELCRQFNKNERAQDFIKKASSRLKSGKLCILQISDYNTTGLTGSSKDIGAEDTAWNALVKGEGINYKQASDSAGSYGLGKGAPFVNSNLGMVFYRTLDEQGIRAAQGVCRLMSFKDMSYEEHEDPIRRSVGYFEKNDIHKPFETIDFLDGLEERSEVGTDVFVIGFPKTSNENEFVQDIASEILDNFLYSIYSGKLEVIIQNRKIAKDNICDIISFCGNKAKKAKMYYEVIRTDNENVIEIPPKDFHGMGTLRLRLLFQSDLNQNILVVRKSGMKIATIPSLPKGISYTGFLELQGDKLNKFFREMETPTHDKWDPGRYEKDVKMAKEYKGELESWVKEQINERMFEGSADEADIDLGNVLQVFGTNDSDNQNKQEKILDTAKKIEIYISQESLPKKLRVYDLGGDIGRKGKETREGRIDDNGNLIGHRHRTGNRTGGSPSGRKGYEESGGPDRVYSGKHLVNVSARVIRKENGANKLIFTPDENINLGELEIVTMGENGKSLPIYVYETIGENITAYAEDGHIVISGAVGGQKHILEFKIRSKSNYSMGVRAYGN